MITLVASQFQNCAANKFSEGDSSTNQNGQGGGTNIPGTPLNPIIRDLKPALVVRGPGCFTCHADVKSSIITDVGLGNSFYRKTQTVYSIYGFEQMSLASDAKVYVPKTEDDLTSYISTVNKFPVETRKSIYIGAPTADRLHAIFGNDATKFIAGQSGAAAPTLSGGNGAYTLSGDVSCDGDLFIDGNLHLKGVSLQTTKGCRLYVTGVVFLTRGLTVSGGDNANLQISSAISINMGTDIADIYSRYIERKDSQIPLRNYANPSNYGNIVLNAANTFTDLISADDEPGGREKAFSRLLLNAPRVDSHYNGSFTGVVIAEAALMSVGDFSFTFDSVFAKVPILPQLSGTDYLDVQF